jgi:hypothetical protein
MRVGYPGLSDILWMLAAGMTAIFGVRHVDNNQHTELAPSFSLSPDVPESEEEGEEDREGSVVLSSAAFTRERHQFFSARASLHHRHFWPLRSSRSKNWRITHHPICVPRAMAGYHYYHYNSVYECLKIAHLTSVADFISFVDNYRLTTVASVLALLCLLSIAYASPIAPSSITSNLCDFEDLPEALPSNLSSIAYLGLNGEFHIHGEFFANYSTHEHNTFFSLPSESYFRISVAPQQDWDVDLFLYSSEQSSPIASAVAFYGEEMITRVLPAGDYRLRFNFLSTISHRFVIIVIHHRLVLLLLSPG